MRRITYWLLSTISAVVLLLSYSTSSGEAADHVAAPVVPGAGTSTDDPDTSTDTSSSSSTGTSADTGTDGSSTSGGQTYTGDVVSTQWGPVQVEITVVDGEITTAEAVQVPSGNHRDEEINGYAVPVYDAAAVEAQSADIDAVSGATVTWEGYTQSLQSAIDEASL